MLKENALAKLKTNIVKIKLDAWKVLSYLANADFEARKAAGYSSGSAADAVLKSFQMAKARIEKEIREFEKKYPD